MKIKNKTYFIVTAALIAALYAGLNYACAMLGLAFGSIQLRFSEVLTVLATVTPAAVPGLTIGCFISNLTSPYGAIDIVCGTLGTFIAALSAYKMREIKFKNLPVLSAAFPSIFNSIIVGLEITFLMPESFKFKAFLIVAFQIFAGEMITSFVMGLIIYRIIKKRKLDKHL